MSNKDVGSSAVAERKCGPMLNMFRATGYQGNNLEVLVSVCIDLASADNWTSDQALCARLIVSNKQFIAMAYKNAILPDLLRMIENRI